MSFSVQVSKESNLPIRSSTTGNRKIGALFRIREIEDIISLFP